MKKNLTINLRGRLYQIDEDAYELLQNYTRTLRNYFRRTEGGDEIVDDIEARIAELMDELRTQGIEAITIEHVQSIISRIGNPEEMEATASPGPSQGGETKGEAKKEEFSDKEGHRESFTENLKGLFNGKKRLFREPDDKKVTGLLAGLAHHFGGDTTWWRVGFVVLILLSFSFDHSLEQSSLHLHLWLIAAYIILSFLVPVAQSPEDRLRMKGMDVNPKNLADEVNAEATAATQPRPQQSSTEGCMSGFFSVIAVMLKILLILGAVALALPLLCFIVFCLIILFSPVNILSESSLFNDAFWQVFQSHPMPVWILAICIVATAGIPLYCAIHLCLTWFNKTRSMSMGQRFAWLIVWLLAIAGIFSSALWIEQYNKEIRTEQWMDSGEDEHEYEEPIDAPTDSLQLDSLTADSLPLP